MKSSLIIACLLCLLAVSCKQEAAKEVEKGENLEAKAMLQGVWLEDETEEISFRAQGDTIFFADSTSMPACFRIIADSLCLGDNSYPIIKQTANHFCFLNQAGDELHFVKSTVDEDTLAFSPNQPDILVLSEVLKCDSVVYYGGERYHWYVAVNPTKYRVTATGYNSEGVGVENVYYDNIIHISLYQGSACLFSRDIKKQMYVENVPQEFLDHAVLGNMQYAHTDARGVHFYATLCIPNGASCYMVDTSVGFDGQLSLTLLE